MAVKQSPRRAIARAVAWNAPLLSGMKSMYRNVSFSRDRIVYRHHVRPSRRRRNLSASDANLSCSRQTDLGCVIEGVNLSGVNAYFSIYFCLCYFVTHGPVGTIYR